MSTLERPGEATAAGSTRLPWAVAALAVVAGLIGSGLGVASSEGRNDLLPTWVVLAVLSIVYPAVGAFLATRPASATIGRLLLGAGGAMAALAFASAYATAGRGDLLFAEHAAWIASWAFVPALSLAGALLLLLFPTGRVSDRRWRPVAWVVVALTAAALVGYAFRPGPLAIGGMENPFGVPALGGLLSFVASAADLLFPVAVAAGAGSLVARYRRASSDEREQIKWIAYVAVLAALGFAATLLPVTGARLIGWALGILGLAGLPVAVAVAVRRYRLYDIDLIINRTLVWVALIGTLGGAYAAAIAILQRLFVALTGNTSDAAVVVTTLILAGIFTPLRKTLEAAVDQRFKPRRAERRAEQPVTRGELDDVLAPLVERLHRLEGTPAAGRRSTVDD